MIGTVNRGLAKPVSQTIHDQCRTKGVHRMFQSDTSNGSTDKCSVGRVLNRRHPIFWVSWEAQGEVQLLSVLPPRQLVPWVSQVGPLTRRAARVGGS